MADQATQQTIIGVPPDRCYEIIADFESYPRWARDVKEATIVAHDDQGRPLEVAFRAAGLGRSARYTLRYDYSGAPRRLSWELVAGDIMRRLDGTYELAEVDGDATRVVYHLAVDLMVPLPGFVKRRAESMIMKTALDELRRHAEAAA